MTVLENIYSIISDAKSIAPSSPDEAIKLCDIAIKKSREAGLRQAEGLVLLGYAFAYRVKSDVSKLLDHSLTALEIFEELSDENGQMRAKNLIGVAYFYSSYYEEAMRYFLESLELSRSERDHFLESSILNNIAEVYRETMSFSKALQYYQDAVVICEREGYLLNKAVILGNIGDIHLRESRYNRAFEYFNASKEILELQEDPISLAEIESRIGKISQLMGDRADAEKQYAKALSILNSINNKYYAIDVLANIGSLQSELSLSQGMVSFKKSIEYALEIDAKKKLIEIYKQIAEQYEGVGKYKEALEYYKLYSQNSDQLSMISLGNRLEILNVELKHTKNYNQLMNLKNRFEQELKLQKLEIERINESNRLLEKKASEDELTGVSNRRSINKKLHETIDLAQIDRIPVAVYMIDIDDFKKYNDCWGHAKGDLCLKTISRIISELSWQRKESFGRYGGEEFVYIGRPENIISSIELGNTIRKAVEAEDIYYLEDGVKYPITISIGGVYGLGEKLQDPSRLMEEADRQMYRSKTAGKNRVSVIAL